jgi:hypothetical protein
MGTINLDILVTLIVINHSIIYRMTESPNASPFASHPLHGTWHSIVCNKSGALSLNGQLLFSVELRCL